MFVPGASHDDFIDAILGDIISSKRKKKGKYLKYQTLKIDGED